MTRTRTPTQHVLSETVELESTVDLLEIEDNLFAFRRRLTATTAKPVLVATGVWPQETVQHGFVDQKNAAKLAKNKRFKELEFEVLTSKELESVRHAEITQALQNVDMRGRNPLEVFQEDTSLTADNVVRFDWSSHMLFDRHGQVLPTGQVFDYIHSGIDETSYDLEALARVLLARPDINVFSGRENSTLHRKLAKTVEQAMFSIPYYNASEGRTRSIQFIWKPSREDFARVWEHAQKFNRLYPSTCIHASFLALDIAGTEACRVDRPAEPVADEPSPSRRPRRKA